MKASVNLAIETYAQLTGRSFEEVANEFKAENKVIVENVIMLMFATR